MLIIICFPQYRYVWVWLWKDHLSFVQVTDGDVEAAQQKLLVAVVEKMQEADGEGEDQEQSLISKQRAEGLDDFQDWPPPGTWPDVNRTEQNDPNWLDLTWVELGCFYSGWVDFYRAFAWADYTVHVSDVG